MSADPRLAGLDYPTIAPAITPIVLDQNRAHFRAGPWSGPNFTVTDDDEDEILADLVRSLDGTRSVDDIVAAFDEHREAIVGLLAQLHERNVVVEAVDARPAQTGVDLHRGPLSRGEFQERLAASETAVITDGRIGEYVASNLSEAGVGSIDVVSPSDGNAPDVSALEGVTLATDSSDVVRSVETAVVCSTTCDYATLLGLNEVACESDTTVVYGQVLGYDGIVGPTVVPGQTACFECFDEHTRKGIQEDEELYAEFKNAVATRRSQSVAPAFAQIVAGYVTLEAIRVLVGEGPILANKIACVDFLDFAFEPNTVLRVPNCDTCGPAAPDQSDWERFASHLQFGDREGDR